MLILIDRPMLRRNITPEPCPLDNRMNAAIRRSMMYQLYQAQADLLLPLRQFARFGACVTRLADCGACTPPLMRHIAAGLTLVRRGASHASPAVLRHRCRAGGRTGSSGDRGIGRRHAVRHAAAFPQGPFGRAAARAAGRADVRPLRHAAAWHSPGDAAGARPLHHRLEERARRAVGRGALRPRRVRRPHHPLPAGHGTWQSRRRGVPAGGARAGRRRGDGGGRRPGAPAQHDADGGTDRHAGQSDQGQRARQVAADRVVRAAPDQCGALALPWRVPPCLSGLRAALRVHEHEPAIGTSMRISASSAAWSAATTSARRRIASSTTSTAR